MLASVGECSGNVRSTPMPSEIFRTVNVFRMPAPRTFVTRPRNFCWRSLSPSITRTMTSTVKPGRRSGRSVLSWVFSTFSNRPIAGSFPLVMARARHGLLQAAGQYTGALLGASRHYSATIWPIFAGIPAAGGLRRAAAAHPFRRRRAGVLAEQLVQLRGVVLDVAQVVERQLEPRHVPALEHRARRGLGLGHRAEAVAGALAAMLQVREQRLLRVGLGRVDALGRQLVQVERRRRPEVLLARRQVVVVE